MSTINNLLNSNLNSSYKAPSSSSPTSVSSIKNQISSIQSDTTLTDDQKKEKLAALNSQLSSQNASAESSKNTSTSGKTVIRQASSLSSTLSTMIGGFNSDLMHSMLGSESGYTSSDVSNFFFSSGKTLGNLVSSYQSSLLVQNQARSLSAEIALDRARGLETSDKQEKLSNLTSNVSLMNKSLRSDINSALKDKIEDKEVVSVIDEIKSSLEKYEDEAKKFVENKFGDSKSDTDQ